MGAFNHGELTVICTNLRKACEKQLRSEEAALFGNLATYFSGKTESPGQATLQEIGAVIDEELATLYPQANEQAEAPGIGERSERCCGERRSPACTRIF